MGKIRKFRNSSPRMRRNAIDLAGLERNFVEAYGQGIIVNPGTVEIYRRPPRDEGQLQAVSLTRKLFEWMIDWYNTGEVKKVGGRGGE